MMRLGSELAAGGGQVFGAARVVVDQVGASCIVEVTRRGGELVKRMQLHSLDEIRGAFSVHSQKHWDPVAQDVARALKFAGMQIAGKGRK